MAGTHSTTITLSPDLSEAAERFAETTHQSVNQVAEKALRAYIDFDPELEAMRKFHRERAASLGLTTDEYVERMIHEYRAERHSESA
jgi:predicted transcriptional regulator